MNPSPEESMNPTSKPAEGAAKGPVKRPKAKRRAVRGPRKPDGKRFRSLGFTLPAMPASAERTGRRYLIAGIVGVTLIGAFFPHFKHTEGPEPKLFVMTEAPPPLPRKPPPPKADPAPPPKIIHHIVTPPPPPQFGLQKDNLAEKSNLTVAAGNTVNAKADSIAAKPTAALPPPPMEPVMTDQAAGVLSEPELVFPESAKDRGIESSVVVMLVTIDTLGRVTDARVEKSGGADFDRTVMAAMPRTRFQASVHNGHRVPIKFRRLYEFRWEGG